MNNQGDPEREVNRRIKDCMATLQKLHIFFYDSDNTVTRKLQMLNAILRYKVMYGFETIVMNTKVFRKLFTFQIKCRREILQIPITYINE